MFTFLIVLVFMKIFAVLKTFVLMMNRIMDSLYIILILMCFMIFEDILIN